MPLEGEGHHSAWLKKASEDELSTRAVLKEGAPSTGCFLSQQMAEKYLKALATYHGLHFRKVHDLIELETLLIRDEPKIKEYHEDLKLLNRYYVEPRYPADVPEFTRDECQQAYEAALRIKDFVLKRMGAASSGGGFSALAVFAVIAGLVIAAGGVWMYRQYSTFPSAPASEEHPPVTQSIAEKIDTSNWKTYRDEEYGFELRYPPAEWELDSGRPLPRLRYQGKPMGVGMACLRSSYDAQDSRRKQSFAEAILEDLESGLGGYRGLVQDFRAEELDHEGRKLWVVYRFNRTDEVRRAFYALLEEEQGCYRALTFDVPSLAVDSSKDVYRSLRFLRSARGVAGTWEYRLKGEFQFAVSFPNHYYPSNFISTSLGPAIESPYAIVTIEETTGSSGVPYRGTIRRLGGVEAVESLTSNRDGGVDVEVGLNDFPRSGRYLQILFSTKRAGFDDKVGEFESILQTFIRLP